MAGADGGTEIIQAGGALLCGLDDYFWRKKRQMKKKNNIKRKEKFFFSDNLEKQFILSALFCVSGLIGLHINSETGLFLTRPINYVILIIAGVWLFVVLVINYIAARKK